MVSVSEPSPSGALFPTFHYGALSGAKNAGNRVENPGIQEILIHRGEYHYGISKYRGKSCGVGISAAAFKVLHKSLSQKSGICYTVTEVLSDGRKDFEIGRET